MLATRTLLALTALLAVGAPQCAENPAPVLDPVGEAAGLPGPYEAGEKRYDWTDASRERPIPVKVYYPIGADTPLHAVVMSHGLGGSREGYAYLGRHWASHGYVSIHPQHAGSDDSVWRDADDVMRAMRAAITTENALARPRDVAFCLDQLPAVADDLGLEILADAAGIAGHSFGAHTTLLCAGMSGGLVTDPRLIAAIPMSTTPPEGRDLNRVYGSVALPCLHMTGTEDESMIVDTQPEDRRVSFDQIGGVDQYLVTFIGGDHMVFSGRPRHWGEEPTDAVFQESIKRCATVYWDAYLRGDSEAMAWLAGEGFEAALAGQAELERKLEAR